ncbi:MAG TPA: lipid-binding SYLF domain-containing protein [Pyrinomonadaceae bacterium]|jgi:lipid-binding SYLF domain-containing protein
MRRSRRHLLTTALAALVACGLAATDAHAQRRGRRAAAAAEPTIPGGRADDAVRRASKAANIITEIMGSRDRGVPKELLDKAEAVVVCPEVIKAALGIGGRRGQCVVARRTPGNWSAPVYYNLSGGSFGPQIGGEKLDLVLLIMNEAGVRGLLEDKFEMGGEAGIAAGPYGRSAAASTNATLDAGILSYSRSKGAYIGAALKGVAITPDNDLNEAFYGKKASELLSDGSIMASPSRVRVLALTLSRYTKR